MHCRGCCRARLLARKASADAMLLDEEALDATGEHALRTAIETGDPWLVVDVQTYAAMRPAVWRSAEALRSDAAALADVAQRTGDGWAHAGARYAQLMAHLHLGEGAAARAAWSSFHELVAPLGILFADNLDLLLEAMWGMGEGRFADADAATQRSLETYYLLENPTAAIAVAGAQTAALRWLRGDVGDLADALDVQTSVLPEHRAWRTAAALARAALGDHDGARARLAQAIDRSAPLPRLMEWSVQVALLAELAVALDDRDLSEWLAPQVEPHVDRGATFVGYLYFGSHAHHLGLLESVLGRPRASRRSSPAGTRRARGPRPRGVHGEEPASPRRRARSAGRPRGREHAHRSRSRGDGTGHGLTGRLHLGPLDIAVPMWAEATATAGAKPVAPTPASARPEHPERAMGLGT